MSVTEDKFYHAKITRREDFGDDFWMIRIQAPGEFRFTAGQYATLGVQGALKTVRATVFHCFITLRARNRVLF